jgi:hypothetical protein
VPLLCIAVLRSGAELGMVREGCASGPGDFRSFCAAPSPEMGVARPVLQRLSRALRLDKQTSFGRTLGIREGMTLHFPNEFFNAFNRLVFRSSVVRRSFRQYQPRCRRQAHSFG